MNSFDYRNVFMVTKNNFKKFVFDLMKNYFKYSERMSLNKIPAIGLIDFFKIHFKNLLINKNVRGLSVKIDGNFVNITNPDDFIKNIEKIFNIDLIKLYCRFLENPNKND